ncbi:hypothetical protein Rhal01_01172 [Rubritalea halochordaticola]|uniref:Resolvase/invertase-type recombinase catalytic domain-containing protein n=1 Tax=Rubritalea halochordaticola TaxID=714537 RepID=A0ABP9UX27_9BACT
MKSTPVAILVRVSTQKQETQRQIHELTEYAQKQGYEIVSVCEESVSGTADLDKRSGLQKVEGLAKDGLIRKVLVHEVSRIARKNSTAHLFIERMEELRVSVYWHSQRIETLLPDGKRNPAASIMFSLLAEMARNERETLSARIVSGLAEARRRGKVLGRPRGSTVSSDELLEKHSDIVKQLKRGKPVRDVAKIVGKGVSTVSKIRQILKQEDLLSA